MQPAASPTDFSVASSTLHGIHLLCNRVHKPHKAPRLQPSCGRSPRQVWEPYLGTLDMEIGSGLSRKGGSQRRGMIQGLRSRIKCYSSSKSPIFQKKGSISLGLITIEKAAPKRRVACAFRCGGLCSLHAGFRLRFRAWHGMGSPRVPMECPLRWEAPSHFIKLEALRTSWKDTV